MGPSSVKSEDFVNDTFDMDGLTEASSNAKLPQTTSSLEGLQSDEQQSVLDVVSRLRKCGIDSMLSLPQLVVCGDQSAGKSSVLEALTQIPFPRNDNLCTRFATEIILRRSPNDEITIKVIPDNKRPTNEQESIKAFKESITDFSELPNLIEKATAIMGLDDQSKVNVRAFAKDVLSIEIEGPDRPQLTLVDLPGLIQTETKGVTAKDVELVAEITNSYISKDRTICLAVVSASNDYANQGILKRVRDIDPKGERTLGIITKPDRLPSGSGSEKAYIELAQNQDIYFGLGWHVLKNRAFEEGDSSFESRNRSEVEYFETSNFSELHESNLGIITLRDRLSRLLFQHIKKELPKLKADVEEALKKASGKLEKMGVSRATPFECKEYLAARSLEIYDLSKAALTGQYEDEYFSHRVAKPEYTVNGVPIHRLRAVIQSLNSDFSTDLRRRGHKYHIDNCPEAFPKGFESHKFVGFADDDELPSAGKESGDKSGSISESLSRPVRLGKSEALQWVAKVLKTTRGKELPGNFNPLLIGELFWEQSNRWESMAKDHVDLAAAKCFDFLHDLVYNKCSKDVSSRLWSSQIENALNVRSAAASNELAKIMEDIKSQPITYNHYYTDTINKGRQNTEKDTLLASIEQLDSGHGKSILRQSIVDLVQNHTPKTEPDMTKHSSQEALQCLLSIYKLSQKTFIDNVTTQVIERHIVRGLEKIFSPLVVSKMADKDVTDIASEPELLKIERDFLIDRTAKLREGCTILQSVIMRA